MSDTPMPLAPDDTAARVTQLLVDHLGVAQAQAQPAARLADDLGADSLDQIELVMALEDEFGFEISDDEAARCTTVQDVLDLVTQKRGSAA